MKINCLVVDDEPIAQDILENYIAKIDTLHLVEKCNNAFEALNILHQKKIDILFLDIKMPTLSGLEMLKTLQNPPKVILTTAFSEFAVESYEYNIADYLLKPIAFERFLKAINKIILPKQNEIHQYKIEEKKVIEPTFIFFKADKKIHKFLFKDILWIEGSGNYVKIHSINKKTLMVLDKLSDLERKLPLKSFIRIHKSYIVNISHIQQMEGNRIFVKDKLIPISASYKKNVTEITDRNK